MAFVLVGWHGPDPLNRDLLVTQMFDEFDNKCKFICANSDDFGMMRKQKDKLRYSLSLSLSLSAYSTYIHTNSSQSFHCLEKNIDWDAMRDRMQIIIIICLMAQEEELVLEL